MSWVSDHKDEVEKRLEAKQERPETPQLVVQTRDALEQWGLGLITTRELAERLMDLGLAALS